MVFSNLHRYVFDEFIFLKALRMDNPGVIINKSAVYFGSGVNSRIVFIFEDMIVELYRRTVDKIGKEKTNELFYKIGKDIGTRYFLFSNKRKFSNNIQLVVLEHIFSILSGIGLSFAKETIPGSNEDAFAVSGSDPLFLKKIKDGSFLSGIFSGILSFVYSENIESECFSSNYERCKFFASRRIPDVYVPSIDELFLCKKYNIKNFNLKELNLSSEKFLALSDFIKFRKVKFDNASNSWSFFGENIFPFEIGLFGIIMDNYVKNGYRDLFCDSYREESEKIFFRLLKEEENIKNRVKFFVNFLSAFGWGVPVITKNLDEFIIRFMNPPYSKYGCMDKASMINGFLNVVYSKDFELISADLDKFVFSEI